MEENIRKNLTPLQHHVTCENGTEPPFNNAYWDNKRPGIYVDVISGEPLFSSKDKYDSGSGWPSFTAPLHDKNIVNKSDTSLGMMRVEVRSKKSDAHLGHVFEDGPRPTGLRYCINSASLRFIPAEDLEKEGYGDYRDLFASTGSAQVASTGSAQVASTGSSHAASTDSAQIEPTEVQTATFGAGCFWGVEAAFQELDGVKEAAVGYLGGTMENPTYHDVCTGTTGHAEVVQVKYDPRQVSYEKLLDLFWEIHDPTTLNRQGPDVGTQYRSAVFYHNAAQEKAARASKEKVQASGRFKRKIVTEITKASPFYRAEEYHQDYLKKRGISSCHIKK